MDDLHSRMRRFNAAYALGGSVIRFRTRQGMQTVVLDKETMTDEEFYTEERIAKVEKIMKSLKEEKK